MKTIQRTKILDLLRNGDWVCVEDMTKLYIVDYRRRLVDIQKQGYELESRRCQQHSHHKGGSKEWRLKTKIPERKLIQCFTEDGRPYVKEVYV